MSRHQPVRPPNSLAVIAALSVLNACGGATPAAPRSGGMPAGPPRVVAGEVDARLVLEDLPARASRLGAGPMSLVASGEVVEGERLGAFVEVPADVCLLAYARASSSLDDIDVSAYADEGNPVANDEARDAHPTVLLCPPHPARVYLTVHVASGEGLVALAAHHVPRERAADVARALGARGGQGAHPRPADAWPGLDDHVRAHRAPLGGGWEEFRKVAVTLDARAPTMVGLPLEANGCVDVVIVPDEDVTLVEVEAMDGDGRVIARAREGPRDRTLTLCSPLTLSGTLAIRPHLGAGLAAVVMAKARAEVVRDVGSRAQVAWVAQPLPLEAARVAKNGELARAGYAPPTASLPATLPLGRRVSLPVELGATTSCGRVDVIGGAPTALLEASLWDPTGALAGAGDGSSVATLFACGRAKLVLEVEARGRPGPALALVRAEPWKDALFATKPLAAARLLARASSGPASLFEGRPLPVRAFALEPARRVAYVETVPAGQCLRVAVGAEGDGGGVELHLFDAPSSDELDRMSAERGASARACAPAGAARDVRIELRAGSGKLDALVGSRLISATPVP